MEDKLKSEVMAKYNLSSVVVDLLEKRGFDTIEKIDKFLHPSEKDFYDPFLLRGMRELVDRVNKAVENNEKVLIFGDYDVDGVSASAILIKYFASKKFYVDYFLPNRYVDGYGLTCESIDFVKNKFNPSLIITVDCGISCKAEVEYAKTLGIEIIVTDHHDIPDEIPSGIVVNAKLPNQDYPFRYLCGTGVAFKIVQALSGLEEAKKYLGIAAIATIADIVPLLNENRAIVTLGMKNFSTNLPAGIKMLFNENKLDFDCSSTDIAFKLSPKINAAGRMGDASVALKLYLKDDKIQLKNTIDKLNELNTERQTLCNKVYEDCIKKLSRINIANYNSIVLYDKKWDSGILGIVSAKIANEFNRPTILLSEVGDELKGSARSVNDIDIFSAISSMKEALETFGGHKMAAGLTVKVKNFKSFLTSLNKYLSEHYSPNDFLPGSTFDLTLRCEDVTPKLVESLEIFEPCGCENSKPVFNIALSPVHMTASPMAKHPNHINISNKNLNFVAFNSYKYLPLLKNSAYRQVQTELQKTTFKDKVFIKGIVKNITTGFLEKPKNMDIVFGEYLKQMFYTSKKDVVCKGINKDKLLGLLKTANEEKFGTLFVCFTFDSYREFLDNIKNEKYMTHYIYEVVSNSGINSIVLAPQNFENFGAYKNIVFLDPILSKGYLNKVKTFSNAKLYVINYRKVDRQIFSGLNMDREVFARYFKLFVNYASMRGSFYDEVDLFNKLLTIDKKINFKQFIFCLYTFIELNILSLEKDMELYSLTEDKKIFTKLDNSKFYREVGLVLESV